MSAFDNTEHSDVPPLGDALEFMRLLWGVDHSLQLVSKRMKTRLGVTGPQRLVLRLVGKFPGILPSHLAQILQLHPSTLTGIVKRLEQQRLVTRRQDDRDGRRMHLALTQRGRETASNDEGTVEVAIRAALERLPREDVRIAESVLSELAKSLELAANGGL